MAETFRVTTDTGVLVSVDRYNELLRHERAAKGASQVPDGLIVDVCVGGKWRSLVVPQTAKVSALLGATRSLFYPQPVPALQTATGIVMHGDTTLDLYISESLSGGDLADLRLGLRLFAFHPLTTPGTSSTDAGGEG